MTTTIYATYDDMTINGIGPTPEEAISDWLTESHTDGDACVQCREIDCDCRAGTYRETARTAPMTAALADVVAREGGAISWGELDGVLCTLTEESPENTGD